MLELDVAVGDGWRERDWERLARQAVEAAFRVSRFDHLIDAEGLAELSLSLSDDGEVHDLNRQWRDKDKPTNVLSFPMMEPEQLAEPPENGAPLMLGDIVLARETCAREAEAKGVALEHHATHLIVHGTLHILGFDHETGEADAQEMEALEVKALASLGLPNPYSAD